jgi:hypothetical protein
MTSPRVRLCHERDETSEAVTPVFVEMLCAIAESRLVTAATPLTVLVRSDPLVESAWLVMISPVPTEPPTLLVIVLPDEERVLLTVIPERVILDAVRAPDIVTLPLKLLFPFCENEPELEIPLVVVDPDTVRLPVTWRSGLGAGIPGSDAVYVWYDV